MTVWPSGLRRWLQAPVRKGVGSNPTAVSFVNAEKSCRVFATVLRCFTQKSPPQLQTHYQPEPAGLVYQTGQISHRQFQARTRCPGLGS